MKDAERDQLVSAFIAHCTREFVWDRDMVLRELRRDSDENFWAWQAFNDAAQKDPELCWSLILHALHTPHTESVDEALAAGPLEDVLAHFGELFIGRVEAQAAADPEFKELLGGVWKNAMSNEVWARVQACRGESW